MSNLFFYKREVKKKVPVENPEEGQPKFTEVVEVVEDCFNVDKVVRGHWTSENEFTVMLDDGHEQADDVQKPVFKNGKISGVENKRERAWFMSQIGLNREDAERFKSVTAI